MIKIIVKTFRLGQIEFLDVHLSNLWHTYLNTEEGIWLVENAEQLTRKIESLPVVDWSESSPDYYRCIVVATLSEENAMYFHLKWGNDLS